MDRQGNPVVHAPTGSLLTLPAVPLMWTHSSPSVAPNKVSGITPGDSFSNPMLPKGGLGARFARMSMAGLHYARRKTWHDMSGDNLRWYEYAVVIVLTVVLAFVAGFVNAITLLSAVNMTVSHLTGLMTNAALALAALKYETVATALGLYLSFLVGSVSSGVVVDTECWRLGQQYGVLLIWEAVVLAMGHFLYFHYDPVLVLFVNAYACGLQNAMGTMYSGAIIRTTHLTGATTDIGIVLGHIARRGLRAADAWKLKFLVPIVISYFVGCLSAGGLHHLLGYHAICVPTGIVGFIGLIYCSANYLASYDLEPLPMNALKSTPHPDETQEWVR